MRNAELGIRKLVHSADGIVRRFRNPCLADSSPREARLSAKPREATGSSCLAGGSSRRARRAQSLPRRWHASGRSPLGEAEGSHGLILPRRGLVKAGKAGAIRNGIRVLLILCMMSLVACGYQMVGKETHVPPGLSSIAIPTFKNKSFEPGIEIPFTQAFLNEFILDRRVKVTDRAAADSILEGAVVSFTAYPATLDASGFVLEYVMTVTVTFSLKDRAGKVLWGVNNASQTQWFQGSSVGPTNEAAKQVAIQKAAAAMADVILQRFFSNF